MLLHDSTTKPFLTNKLNADVKSHEWSCGGGAFNFRGSGRWRCLEEDWRMVFFGRKLLNLISNHMFAGSFALNVIRKSGVLVDMKIFRERDLQPL